MYVLWLVLILSNTLLRSCVFLPSKLSISLRLKVMISVPSFRHPGLSLEPKQTGVLRKLGRAISYLECLAAASRSSPSERRSYRHKVQPSGKYLKHLPSIGVDGTCKYFGLDQNHYVLNTGYRQKAGTPRETFRHCSSLQQAAEFAKSCYSSFTHHDQALRSNSCKYF